jgi:hypothetical protein
MSLIVETKDTYDFTYAEIELTVRARKLLEISSLNECGQEYKGMKGGVTSPLQATGAWSVQRLSSLGYAAALAKKWSVCVVGEVCGKSMRIVSQHSLAAPISYRDECMLPSLFAMARARSLTSWGSDRMS